MSSKEIKKGGKKNSPNKPPSRWIYGLNAIKETLTNTPTAIKSIYVLTGNRNKRALELINLATELEIEAKEVEAEFFTPFENSVHQGVCAIVTGIGSLSLMEALKRTEESRDPPLFLIVDRVEDPRNFGAILRTSECAGATAVVYQKKRQVGLSVSVDKVSSGASMLVDKCEVSNVKNAIRFLKSRGVFIYGADESADKDVWDVDLTGPVGFVLGSESEGLRRIVRESCDGLLRIPLFGKIGSLNVSVACGVFLFECRRQRLQSGDK